MAGQVTDTFPQIRACLEYAGYGLHIYKNPDLTEIWLRRHDSEESMQKIKKSFSHGNICKSIKATDQKLEEVFRTLYERAIDFGAHPNERGFTSSLQMKDEEDHKRYLQAYLLGDSKQLDHVLKTTAEAGRCVLLMLQECFQARSELLGVREKLDHLKGAF